MMDCRRRVTLGRRPTRWAAAFTLAFAIAVGASPSPAHASPPTGPADSTPADLRDVRSWAYWLQSYDVPRLTSLPVDMLVVDYARSDPAGGAMIPFTAAEVLALKQHPDGRRRIALAYLSIGEAEEYRFYWDPAWRDTPPAWHIAENCRWPRNHLVKYWDRAWKDIMYRRAGSYLDRIIDAGFDGIYVDRIDSYDDLKSRHPDARTEMIALMTEMSAIAKAKRPGFLIVAQNAEALLSSDGYRHAIDGIAKEDLLNGVGGTGVRNTSDLISWSQTQITSLTAEGGVAFAVEYLRDAASIEAARAEVEPLGITPTFPTRALDGGDPLTPDPPTAPASENYGTPEYGEKRCDGVFFKKRE